MSFESLLEKIGDDARTEGRAIVDTIKEEAARLLSEGEEEARLTAEAIRASFRERGERERTKIMSEALAESRSAFLSAQANLFEEAFMEALRDFADLPEERYRAWLKRIILENVSGGKEEIVAAPYDRGLLADGLLDEINLALKEKGSKASLKLAKEKADFDRGVILRSGNYINNLSLETLMREVRDRHEENVLKILFGEVDVRGAAR
jgi:vacuolar-type H+-ATPase subunit E/Vma4